MGHFRRSIFWLSAGVSFALVTHRKHEEASQTVLSAGTTSTIPRGGTTLFATSASTTKKSLKVVADELIRPARYLIASSADSSQVVYSRLASGSQDGPHPLVESGIESPRGIAVDNKSSTLYVTDSGGKKVLAFSLLVVEDGSLTARFVGPVEQDVDATDVSVDSLGKVFFSNPNEIREVDKEHVAMPTKIYEASTTAEIKSATSLFVDNLSVYWANGAQGGTVGSVVKAPQRRPIYDAVGSSLPGLAVMTKSVTNSTEGICGAGDVLFFTDSSGSLLRGSKSMTSASAVAVVDNTLEEPKHCAWDRGSSVLVADKTGVYAYSGALSKKQSTSVTKEKLIDFPGAVGVDVFFAPMEGLPKKAGPGVLGKVVVGFTAFAICTLVFGTVVVAL